MPDDFYSNIAKKLLNLKPKLLEILQNREMEVRDREDNAIKAEIAADTEHLATFSICLIDSVKSMTETFKEIMGG